MEQKGKYFLGTRKEIEDQVNDWLRSSQPIILGKLTMTQTVDLEKFTLHARYLQLKDERNYCCLKLIDNDFQAAKKAIDEFYRENQENLVGEPRVQAIDFFGRQNQTGFIALLYNKRP